MAKGLYYYKLVSPYQEDVTKNCKLTVNEIDSNFLTLKDEDIKSAELDEKTNSVILTRNNGDKLVVDLTPILSGAVYDLKVVYENPDTGSCSGGSTVYVTYSTLTSGDVKQTITVPITGLVTTENINTVLGGGLLTKVTTDSTLTGNGTKKSPLGISELYKDTPAIKLIDKTNGEDLPETPQKGDKYVTKEKTSDFGQLYNNLNIEQITEILKEEFGSDDYAWHVPSKEEWDCLLNSIEPCDYQNHGDEGTNIELGKYAGKKLKATCAWLGEPDCECKNTRPDVTYCNEDDDTTGSTGNEGDYFDDDEPTPYEPAECDGTDEFGMRILPTGIKSRFDATPKKTEEITAFWTNTLLCDSKSEHYIKMFNYDKCKVRQESANPNDFYSLRLVKKFDGENYIETETIDGMNYRTLLFPECEEIWIESNFASKIEGSVIAGNEGKYGRIIYYVNVWNGKRWEKRALNEGESIVLIDGNEHCLYNIEYRVFLESDETGCNNQVLISSDEAVAQRVESRVYEKYIIPLSGAIDTEKEEREKADAELWEALNEEISARTEADEVLQEEIVAESERAQNVEGQLWDAINAEAQAREEVDQQLWEAIENEASARTEVDTQLWEAIAEEASARTDVDNQLWDAIAQEASARTEVDTQLWEAIAEEASSRTEVDNQLWNAIAEEARIREEIDNQQWDAINAEIERAIAREDEIDGQLVDVSKNPYVLSVNNGGEPNLILESKDGNEEHFIKIKLNADFGTF